MGFNSGFKELKQNLRSLRYMYGIWHFFYE